jgi:cardiolipin synthase
MIVILLILFEVLGVLSAVHSVMNTRTPQGSIAWVVSLLAVPFVAVPAYWVFGRNKFNGYVLTRKNELSAFDGLVHSANKDVESYAESDYPRRGALSGVEKMARIPLTRANSAELLIDGDATFTSILDGIDAARDYILVQFYIVRDDKLGNELKDRLIAKARSGVRVFFLYDEIGSIGLSRSFIEELQNANVSISPFHSRKGSGNRFQLNFRNHRKSVVVDGKVAWIGGHNVGDEYVGRDTSVGKWRDTHVRIAGPAVIGAQVAFVEDWQWASDEWPANLNWQPYLAPGARSKALIISSGPADEMETMSLLFTQAINSATQRIWIASPYFVPDDAIIQALQLAGLRGVDVRILIPEKTDIKLITLVAYSYFTDVKAAGVKIYRYQDGFLHGKAMLIDDTAATVGTANFDNRSFRLNFEITTLVVDEIFANEVKKMFERDFAASRIMEPDEFDKKSFWFRLSVRFSRLFAPIL